MKASLHWFIYEWRFSLPVLALAIPGGLSALYLSVDAMNPDNAPWYFSSTREYQGMLLLMTLMPAYIMTASVYGQRRSLQIARMIDRMNHLNLSQRVTEVSLAGLAVSALLGFLYAVIFNIPSASLTFPEASPTERAMMFGQVLIWVTLACMLYLRITVSRAFRSVSESVEINIFETSNLRPFAQTGLLDVLFIVLGLVLSTVQSLDLSFRPDNYSKAVIILVPAIIYLALYPVWGIHKRMAGMRQQQLDELNRLIRDASKSLAPEQVNQLEVLLQRRERVTASPAWPIDLGTVQRFLFYIIIPPLAWVGAALVEFVLDGIISG